MATKQDAEDDLLALKISPQMRRAAPHGSSPTHRRGLWAIAGAVAAAVIIFAVMNARSAPVSVEVDRAQLTTGDSVGATLIASGYVVPHRQIEVGSKVMGKVAWIGVEKGDKVKKGQLLVRLEDDEYRAQVDRARGALATAQASYDMLKNGSRPQEIARDQAALDDAKVTYDRDSHLAAAGVLSQQELDDAKARYESALNSYQLTKLGPRTEQIEQARAAIEQARGDLAFAQTQLDATRITAPADGTILDRVVENGELVTTMFTGDRGAKSYVVSLADLNDIRVELDINQNDFARISMNQPCDIVLEAYPNVHYQGRVIEISPEANREKGTVQVKVQFAKPDAMVRPEMLARVSFEAVGADHGQVEKSSAAHITIARSARVQRDNHDAVFVVEDGRARLRTVQTVDSSMESGTGDATGNPNDDRLIVTQGLTGGEEVIVNPTAGLRDGAHVTVGQAKQ